MINLPKNKLCLASGNQALIRGDYDQAQACYREALRVMPELSAIIKANIELAEVRRLKATHGDGLKVLLESAGWTFEEVLHWAMVWFRAILAGAAVKSEAQVDTASREAFTGQYNSWVSIRFQGITPENFVNQPDGLPRYEGITSHENGYLPLVGLLYGGLLSVFVKAASIASPGDLRWLDPRFLALEILTGLEQVIDSNDQTVIEQLWQLPAKPAFQVRAD